MTLRDELIQVAAVAVAFVETLDRGHTMDPATGKQVLLAVADERHRQNLKWGPQSHSSADWLAILGEEYGEACKAHNEQHGH